jgi:hypothetical protein
MGYSQLSFDSDTTSFVCETLIQFRVRLQSHLLAMFVSKLRYLVEVWTQGLGPTVQRTHFMDRIEVTQI